LNDRYNSPIKIKASYGFSASTLRLLALGFMLLDHMWATVIPGSDWMTCIGRLAFPIFAFQVTEGYFHTSNVKRYMLRLLLFGVISEIPFNLMLTASPIFPFHQNVMFTMLLGLLAISAIEKLKQEISLKTAVLTALKLLLIWLAATVGFVDYGWLGVLTVVVFYLFRGFRFAWLFQLGALTVIHGFLMKGRVFVFELLGMTLKFPLQGFAVFAILLIWLYNGQKGRGGKLLQYGSYVFYPAHMLLLYIIYRLI